MTRTAFESFVAWLLIKLNRIDGTKITKLDRVKDYVIRLPLIKKQTKVKLRTIILSIFPKWPAKEEIEISASERATMLVQIECSKNQTFNCNNFYDTANLGIRN